MSQKNLKRKSNNKSNKSNNKAKKSNKNQRKNKNVKGGYQPVEQRPNYYSEYSGTTYPTESIGKSEYVCNYSGVYGGANELSADDLNNLALKGKIPAVRDPLHSVGGSNKVLYKLRSKSNKRRNRKCQRAGGLVDNLVNKVKNGLGLSQQTDMNSLNNSLKQYDDKLDELEQQIETVQQNQANNEEVMKSINNNSNDMVEQEQEEVKQENNQLEVLEQNSDKVSQAAEQMEQAVNSSQEELKGGNKLTPSQVSNAIKSNNGHMYSNMSRGDGGVNANLSVMSVNQQGDVSGKTTEVNLIKNSSLTGGSRKQKREVRNSKWIDEVKDVMRKNNLPYAQALKVASQNRKNKKSNKKNNNKNNNKK